MEINIDGPSGPLQLLAVVLIGLGTIGYGGYSYLSQTAALDSAVEVNATVSETSVEKNVKKRGDSYTPQATFNYTYEGTQYTSSKVYPGKLPREFGSREKARAKLAGYAPGETVTAFVPQESPGNAFLMYERSNKPFLVMGFGVLFVLGGLVSAIKN